MARGKISFSLMLSVLVLLLIVVVAWQYNNYFKQRYALISNEQPTRALLLQVESLAEREPDFPEQVAELDKRYQALRRQLPEALGATEFKQWLEEQFQGLGLAIQAQREARFTRQEYQEVRFSYSLLGSSRAVQKLVRRAKAQPRMVLIREVKKETDKSSGVVLSIFSAPMREEVIIPLTACRDKPEELLFPFLNTELDLLYADYLQTCRELNEYRDFYRKMQRHRHLVASVLRLQAVYDSLAAAKP